MGLGPQALKRNVLLLRYGTSKLVPFPFVRFLIQSRTSGAKARLAFCCVTAVKLMPFPIVQLLQFSARPQLPGRAAFHF